MTGSMAAEPPAVIRLLAHPIRWHLVQQLTVSDLRVNELVTSSGQPLNLVSYHLKQLRQDELVHTRRSEADGRDVYYRLDLVRLRQAYLDAGASLHPALRTALPLAAGGETRPPLGRKRVLFLCTHNSARSQMAEALLRQASGGAFDVYSAGSEPAGVHPEAIRAMDRLGLDIRGQQAKHFDALGDKAFDYVITVCDKAREVCPTFPGEGRQFHWGFPDPVTIVDTDAQRAAFDATAEGLQTRIDFFVTELAQG